ncbi:MAG: EamA family transporter, partial [Acidobacteria bacterium]|nr:EamA family transporter [Acidobacteriota bacterium]
AAVLLLGFAFSRRLPLGRSRREVALWWVNGLLTFVLTYGIVYWAEQRVPSGLTAVLFATFPLFVALLAQVMLTAERLSGRDPGYSSDLGYAFAAAGHTEKAREILHNLSTRPERYVSPYDLAIVHVALGEHDRALELLKKAVRERSNRVTALKVDPVLDPLRDHPRFEALLREVGLHTVPDH